MPIELCCCAIAYDGPTAAAVASTVVVEHSTTAIHTSDLCQDVPSSVSIGPSIAVVRVPGVHSLGDSAVPLDVGDAGGAEDDAVVMDGDVMLASEARVDKVDVEVIRSLVESRGGR